MKEFWIDLPSNRYDSAMKGWPCLVLTLPGVAIKKLTVNGSEQDISNFIARGGFLSFVGPAPTKAPEGVVLLEMRKRLVSIDSSIGVALITLVGTVLTAALNPGALESVSKVFHGGTASGGSRVAPETMRIVTKEEPIESTVAGRKSAAHDFIVAQGMVQAKLVELDLPRGQLSLSLCDADEPYVACVQHGAPLHAGQHVEQRFTGGKIVLRIVNYSTAQATYKVSVSYPTKQGM